MKETHVLTEAGKERMRRLAELKQEAEALSKISRPLALMDEQLRRTLMAPVAAWSEQIRGSVLQSFELFNKQFNSSLLESVATFNEQFLDSILRPSHLWSEEFNKSLVAPLLVWDEQFQESVRSMIAHIALDAQQALRSVFTTEEALRAYLNEESWAELDFSPMDFPKGPVPARPLTTDQKFALLIIVAWVLAVAGAMSREEAIGLTGTAIAAWDFYTSRTKE